VTLKEVIPVRTKATRTLGQLKGRDLAPEQGIGAKLAACEETHDNADEFYRQEAWGDAKLLYEDVLTKCAELTQLDADRTAARKAEALAMSARQAAVTANAAEFTSSPWPVAEAFLAKAAEAFSQGKFTSAKGTWTAAATAYAKATEYSRGVSSVRAARGKYERALAGCDAARIRQDAAEQWRVITAEVQEAEAADKTGQFATAVSAYEKATGLLPAAERVAEKSETDAKVAALLSKVKKILAKMPSDAARVTTSQKVELQQARKAVAAALVYKPVDREALVLKVRIASYFDQPKTRALDLGKGETMKQVAVGHPDTTGPGWKDLFKTDLSNAIYPKGAWSFTDGVLTATRDINLWSKKQYEDFIIDLEFKTDKGTNSGVIVHCSDTRRWIPNCVEIQIADDYASKWAKAPKTWQCGAIFGHLAASKQRVVKKPGEWNRYTITCKGKIITVVLNGEKVTVMDMRKWTSSKTNPAGDKIPGWLNKPKATLPLKGHIGFQGKHAGAPIYFRNIKIKEL